MNVTGNDDEKDEDPLVDVPHSKLINAHILDNLENKYAHIDFYKQQQLINLDFSCPYSDVPGRTTLMHHYIDISDNGSVKQHPSRENPTECKQMRFGICWKTESLRSV